MYPVTARPCFQLHPRNYHNKSNGVKYWCKMGRQKVPPSSHLLVFISKFLEWWTWDIENDELDYVQTVFRNTIHSCMTENRSFHLSSSIIILSILINTQRPENHFLIGEKNGSYKNITSLYNFKRLPIKNKNTIGLRKVMAAFAVGVNYWYEQQPTAAKIVERYPSWSNNRCGWEAESITVANRNYHRMKTTFSCETVYLTQKSFPLILFFVMLHFLRMQSAARLRLVCPIKQ